jgi:hypothetical protein
MNKNRNDSKVKKTLVRNYEQPANRKHASAHDTGNTGCTSNISSENSRAQNRNNLNEPSLCSSAALANYLTDIKLSLPLTNQDLNVDKGQLGAKVSYETENLINIIMVKIKYIALYSSIVFCVVII